MITYSYLGGNGRLGNQLWQIASTMGIAFRQTGNHKSCRFPAWSYASWFSVPEFFFAMEEPDADLGTDYLQDLQYWIAMEETIREYFTPAPGVQRDLLKDHGSDPFIALHVRRGDAIGKELYHPIMPLAYYENALSTLPDLPVEVYSDDIEWCRRNFPSTFSFASPPLRDPNGSNRTDALELFMMTRAKHHVIANSTYSWWGAFLSDNKEVRYPSLWYGPKLPDVNWRLMIPESWVEVVV